MADEEDHSDSETQSTGSDSSSEDLQTTTTTTPIINSKTHKKKVIPQYEKERMKRIESNRARMEALGLPKMASTLMGSAQIQRKRDSKSESKGKSAKRVEEDEEYKPPEQEDCSNSSSDEEEEEDEIYGSRAKKVKKKSSNVKGKLPAQKVANNSDFVDDDEALMQAIALSLKDSSEFQDVVHGGPSRSSGAQVVDGMVNEIKGKGHNQEDPGKRKRKKPINARVQMTEDELVVHFFQFDEAGKGGISLRDIRRVAAAHDFPWTDQEIADMIFCFDSDGDGKLNLDDFRKVVARCNMIQGSENSVMGSNS